MKVRLLNCGYKPSSKQWIVTEIAQFLNIIRLGRYHCLLCAIRPKKISCVHFPPCPKAIPNTRKCRTTSCMTLYIDQKKTMALRIMQGQKGVSQGRHHSKRKRKRKRREEKRVVQGLVLVHLRSEPFKHAFIAECILTQVLHHARSLSPEILNRLCN